MTAEVGPPPTRTRDHVGLLIAIAIGAAVSVVIGVYGQLHTPAHIAVSVAGFSSPVTVKVWLATGAAALALVQLVTALAMWGKFGLPSAPWTATVHRWSGRAAFLLTIPVAMHCLYA